MKNAITASIQLNWSKNLSKPNQSLKVPLSVGDGNARHWNKEKKQLKNYCESSYVMYKMYTDLNSYDKFVPSSLICLT